jgi:imidazolonepropionase-like amidohydrolase
MCRKCAFKIRPFKYIGSIFIPTKHYYMRKSLPRGSTLPLFLLLVCHSLFSAAQTTFPVNGVADPREHCYAFTHATIVKDGATTLSDATLVIRDGLIVGAGTGLAVPKDAVVIDCRGKYIYPSFIDLYSDYGMPVAERGAGRPAFDFRAPAQMESNTKGAYNWNQAIHPETDAFRLFTSDESRAKPLREIGFGTVLSHVKDGIARGTGVVVTLADQNENFAILKQKASANYSLSKGTSTQNYPSSLMGSIALLRQTYLDGQWYKTAPRSEGTNLSLQAFDDEQSLPQIFEGDDKWQDLHGDRIGKEFGVQYIIKAGGNEYQRISDIAATKATYIVPVNYPQAMDVEDPDAARFVSLADMKHWELAPTNPGAFEKAGINFCLTASDLRDQKTFLANIRKAFDYGLTEAKALEALTKTPATLIGIYDKVGSLDAGKLANFLITTGPVFNEKTNIVENWVQGKHFDVKDDAWKDIRGQYNLVITSADGMSKTLTLDVKSSTAANVIGKDTLTGKFNYDGKLISLSFPSAAAGGGGGAPAGGGRRFGGGGARPTNATHLSGIINGDTWNGNGTDTAGNLVIWSATFSKTLAPDTAETTRNRRPGRLGKVLYPFNGYGWDSLPTQHDLLIKNATVWTNEKEGRLPNTDVLVHNGKIARIGKNLDAGGARVIDGTGKYLAPGIIDEHSHIAAFSINEGAHSVTSEVRIADNLNPEDISIYRILSGGVTSSHILHGSANTIGGQTQLIKLRWGQTDTALKFRNWDPFIKFALGENVKRTTSTNNNRFPDTRMGVEEVLTDAFTRASDYERQRKAAPNVTRRDLQLDALVEIMEHKRFITCHSYVQSEITALMRVGDKFGFKVNTFTHILEGYKVADKMKAEGCNASTFSDWWAYKIEVTDAMAYNATIMQRVGLNVCINSDDAEQARHLNQEAAKSVKYGGMSEEDAFKMCTLNPAIALHVADRVGSIKEGKDADLVLWSDNPLSIYARAEKTIVDGIIYYDIDHDLQMRKYIVGERNRLIQKMIAEKRTGAPMAPATPSNHLLTADEDGDGDDDSSQTAAAQTSANN